MEELELKVREKGVCAEIEERGDEGVYTLIVLLVSLKLW